MKNMLPHKRSFTLTENTNLSSKLQVYAQNMLWIKFLSIYFFWNHFLCLNISKD